MFAEERNLFNERILENSVFSGPACNGDYNHAGASPIISIFIWLVQG